MFHKPGLDAVIFSPEVRTVQFLPFAVAVIRTHKSTQVQVFRLSLAHHEPIFITPVHPVRLGQISFRQCVLAVTHPCDRCTDILTQHIHRVEFPAAGCRCRTQNHRRRCDEPSHLFPAERTLTVTDAL